MNNFKDDIKSILDGYNFTITIEDDFTTTLELRQLLYYLEETIISILTDDDLESYYGWGRNSKLRKSGIRLRITGLNKKSPETIDFVIISLTQIVLHYSSIKQFMKDLKEKLSSRISKGRSEISGKIVIKVKKDTKLSINEKEDMYEIRIEK